MTDILLIAFFGVLVTIMALQLRRKSGHYEYPFLAAAVFGGFVLMQAVGLRNDAGLPEGSLAKVAVMSMLCVIACMVGFRLGAHRLPVMNWVYDERKLLHAAYVLVGIGAFFSVLISRLPKDQIEVSQWTGKPVAYIFFAQCFHYGFAIAFFIFLRSKRKAALLPILVASFLYMDTAAVGVRRTVAVGFFLTILLSIWFVKRRCLPQTAFLVCICVGILGLYSIGELRAIIMGDKAYASILEGDFMPANAGSKTINPLQKTRDVLEHGGSEVRNAAHLMAAVEEGLSFDFGMNDWNALVFTLVPAQVFGRDFKNALMFPVNSPLASGKVGGYDADTGTTFCGIGDAFESFWYFGFVKFLLIGWALGTLYNCALKGSWTACILYMVLVTDGLVAITHSTDLFLTSLAHLAILVLPFLWYAKRGELRGEPRRSRAAVAVPQPGSLVKFPGAMRRFGRRNHFFGVRKWRPTLNQCLK